MITMMVVALIFQQIDINNLEDEIKEMRELMIDVKYEKEHGNDTKKDDVLLKMGHNLQKLEDEVKILVEEDVSIAEHIKSMKVSDT